MIKKYRFKLIYLFIIFTGIYLYLFIPFIYAGSSSLRKGVWVSCFSKKEILYSKEAVLGLVEFCKRKNINEVYLQFYRGGHAYYDSKISDRTKYEEIIKKAGMDTIDFLLNEAGKNNIMIFAWVNVLTVSQNKKADIIAKFGEIVLTKDQHLRPSMRTEAVNESDKYYLRDEQLFLEPGDTRVADYITAIIGEIVTRYPLLAGVHLDYIRYPYPIPYLPRSNFNKFGLTYGYGEENIRRFKEKTGLDPLVMPDTNDNFLMWDNWKREQVTNLVERLAKCVKAKSPDKLISCAVLPSSETAYSAAFQDWPLWLEKGIVDYVILMNYTRNNQLAKEITRSAIAHRGKGRVFIGIGIFLMKDDPALLSEQERIIEGLNPDGVVFFSYDFMY